MGSPGGCLTEDERVTCFLMTMGYITCGLDGSTWTGKPLPNSPSARDILCMEYTEWCQDNSDVLDAA